MVAARKLRSIVHTWMQLSEADPTYTVDLDGAIDYIHGFHDDYDLDDDGVGELLSHSRILDFSGRVVYIVNTPDAHSCRFNPNLRDGDQVIYMCDSDMDHGTGGVLSGPEPSGDNVCDESKVTCFFCHAVDPSAVRMKRCSRCGVARYCDTQCQKRDWRNHKPACEELRDAKHKPWQHVANTMSFRAQCTNPDCLKVHDLTMPLFCPVCSSPSRGLPQHVHHQTRKEWHGQMAEEYESDKCTGAQLLSAVDQMHREKKRAVEMKRAARASTASKSSSS